MEREKNENGVIENSRKIQWEGKKQWDRKIMNNMKNKAIHFEVEIYK